MSDSNPDLARINGRILAAGEHLLKVRATNNAGKGQPETAGWNPPGYMRNVIESVRVTAA